MSTRFVLGSWILAAGLAATAQAQSAVNDPAPARVTVTNDCTLGEVKECYAGQHNRCCPDKGDGIAMDVGILRRPAWRAVLQELGISASELLAALDRRGVAYDPLEAARVVGELDGPSPSARPASWTVMKKLYD